MFPEAATRSHKLMMPQKYGYDVRKRVYDHMGYQRKSCEAGYGRIDRIVSFLRWLGTMYSKPSIFYAGMRYGW